MAPVGESFYFPPLDKCLSREHCLISWKTAYIGLTQVKTTEPSVTLQRFLSDAYTVELLSRPFEPFKKPTSQTKSSFETKTAAINVTPSIHGQYDINQVKDDALWLSKETEIDELSALRIVVQEWQTRSTAHLLNGFSAEEAASLQDVAGANGFGTSFLGLQSSIPPAVTAGHDTFALSINQQLRLIDLYLAERRYILKVCECLVYACFQEKALVTKSRGKGRDTGKEKDRSSWVAELGGSILEEDSPVGGASQRRRSLCLGCIHALQPRIDGLQQGSGYFKAEGGQDNIEEAWGKNQILEMIHIMQLIFLLVDSSTEITASSVIVAWFRFTGRYSFFDNFALPYDSSQALTLPFQSMLAMVSLALLKLPLAINHLLQSVDAPTLVGEQLDASPYMIDSAAINELNEILLGAAATCLTTACPAVFAWGILMQTLREVALIAKESRELRQSQRAADDFGTQEMLASEREESSATEDGSRRQPRRRTSTSSEASQPTIMAEEILDRIMDSALEEDPIVYLAKSAVNGSHVFDVIISLATDFCPVFCTDHRGEIGLRIRVTLLDLIRASLEWIDYLPEVVLAALAVLATPDGYWETEARTATSRAADPTTIFLEDELLMDKLFKTALTRFPYESLPFLKLCRTLASCRMLNDEGLPLVSQFLNDIGTFTHILPSDFNDYRLIHEDENANYVALTSTLDVFFDKDSKHSRKLSKLGQQQALPISGVGNFRIPEGTNGRVLSESKPVVAIWTYQYSGLKYLGRLLENFVANSDLVGHVSSEDVTRDVVVEIIGLFSVMLTASVKGGEASNGAHNGCDAAQKILEDASDGLNRNGDVISIIFDILEEDVQRQHSQSNVEGSLDLVVQCMHFVQALIPVMPGRVWPLMARSGLLEMDTRGGMLAALVASTEIVSGRYHLLLASIRIFDALVEDAVAQAIPRKGTVKAVARFTASKRLGTGIPDNVMRKVLLAFGRTMIDFYESSVNWKFVKLDEKLEVHTRIPVLFDKILLYCFSVDDNPDLSKKPAGVLAPLAEYVLEVFLSISMNELPVQPLLRVFADGITTPESTIAMKATELWTLQVDASLKFCTSLIQVGSLLQHPRSYLEQQLFKTTAILVRLYVTHETYKVPLVCLFEALVRSAVAYDTEPPSLLGHLGPKTAKDFLDVLANLDKPLDNETLNVCIWHLLSAVISNRQPWFATYLLTGTTPRDSLKTGGKGVGPRSSGSKSLLAVALDSVADVRALKPRKALALLEFIALAEDYWPWVMSDTDKHPKFLTGISDFVGALETIITSANQDKSLTGCQHLRMASYIAEILAMYLHHSQQMGDGSFARRLVSKISYLVNNAVKVPSYNASLHGNLRKNFGMKFPGCNLGSFKRTLLTRRQLGEDYFYDIKIAEKMLGFDPAWSGTRGQGFADEFARANLNLSVVESQADLLHSFKFLAIELISVLEPEKGLQKSLAKIVNDCLLSNSQSTLPENIFRQLMQVRADFAFVLLQRLTEVKSPEPEVKALLAITWNTVRTSGTSLELAMAGNDAGYHRSLLKVLFLALQFHLSTFSGPSSTFETSPSDSQTSNSAKSMASPETTRIVLEIITTLVVPSFRSLTTQLHDDSQRSSSSAADFALITAILQTALRVPGIDKFHTKIVSHLAENQTARYAATLFSWSDQLTVDGDPIYGELSILFFVELSSMPSIAEYLATEGLLTHLSNANIMNNFRHPKGCGPFDEPTRLYAVWSRGLLPLCLNLVNAIGAQMAAEIAAFLNQFPNQLARAADSLDSKPPSAPTDPTANYITLAMASEVHSLALISFILDNYRAAGASAGIVGSEIAELQWDRAQVKEDLEGWLQRRGALRERIVPMNEREGQWVRQKRSKAASDAENRLEEKVLEEMDSALVCLGGGSQ